MTAQEIANVAAGAGFSGSGLVIAIAVALAESPLPGGGGDPNAHCLNCFPGIPEDSRGLWQINVNAHPQWLLRNLYDPATNAQAAFDISNGGSSFGDWSTFTGGDYRQYLPEATAATGVASPSAPPAIGPAATNPTSQNVSSTNQPGAAVGSSETSNISLGWFIVGTLAALIIVNEVLP